MNLPLQITSLQKPPSTNFLGNRSPKSQPLPSAQTSTTRRSGGAFGNYTFGPETMGWTTMGAINTDSVRSRGGTVMPEPETDEKMKELAQKGGLQMKLNEKGGVAWK